MNLSSATSLILRSRSEDMAQSITFFPPRRRHGSSGKKTNIGKIHLLTHANIIFILISLISIALLVLSEPSTTDQNLCQPTNSYFCNNDNYYTWLAFNNSLGHSDLVKARHDLNRYTYLIEMPQCKERVSLFLCSLYFPVCIGQSDMAPRMLLPCKETCLEARMCEREVTNYSGKWPDLWNCDRFEYYNKSLLCVTDTQSKNDNERSRMYESNQQTSPVRFIESKQMHGSSKQPSESSDNHALQISETKLASDNATNISVCEPGLFDCKLNDPKRPLCIDMKYVCDGKKDCYRNDSANDPNEGLDESKCVERCYDGQLQCDERCISRHDICNGKVDCSSGIDEQDCYDNMAGLIQSILCIFIMSSAVFILIKFLRIEHELSGGRECETSFVGLNNSDSRIQENITPAFEQEQYKQPQTLDNKMAPPLVQLLREPSPQPIILNHSLSTMNIPHEPMYQEVSTRSDNIYNYERVLPGGYSGASSIYASYCGDDSALTTRSLGEREFIETVAPPPTRSTTPVYDSSIPMQQDSYRY